MVVKVEDEKLEPMLLDNPVNISYRPLKDRTMSKVTMDNFQYVNHLMQKDFNFLPCPLDQLIEDCVVEAGIDIENKVDLVLTDPPYNIRR